MQSLLIATTNTGKIKEMRALLGDLPPQMLHSVAGAEFMDFFIDESCGWCVPCRVGNVLIKERLDRFRQGKAMAEDLDYLDALCTTVKATSRCGLGQTSPNPVQTTLQNFRALYESKVVAAVDGKQPTFDLTAAMADAVEVQGRAAVFHED